MQRIGLMLVAVAVSVWSAAVVTQVRAEVALRAAIEQETVKGDLKGAIEAYRKIVDGYADNRAVRAQALVRLADAYRKLGDAQAKQFYERVIREFADQREQVTIARSRIGQPATGGTLTARRVWTLPSGGASATNVSPDGLFLSYVADGDLAIRDLTGPPWPKRARWRRRRRRPMSNRLSGSSIAAARPWRSRISSLRKGSSA